MNEHGDPEREVIMRIEECMATLQTLHVFAYIPDNTITTTLQMFNAMPRANSMYGLETVAMNTRVLNQVNAFHAKCMRNILKLPTGTN